MANDPIRTQHRPPPTVDEMCWNAVGKCAETLQRPLSVDEAAAVYVAAWHGLVDSRPQPSTISEQTMRCASLLKASLDWKDPRGPGEAVN